MLPIQVDDFCHCYDRPTNYPSFLCFTTLNPMLQDKLYRQILRYRDGLSSTGSEGGERFLFSVGQAYEVLAPIPVPHPPTILAVVLLFVTLLLVVLMMQVQPRKHGR